MEELIYWIIGFGIAAAVISAMVVVTVLVVVDDDDLASGYLLSSIR